MSRTDKTQPFRVKLWDGTLARVAVHDHRFDGCDLPGTLLAELAERRWISARAQVRSSTDTDTLCYWDVRFTGT